jgi:hypothetical protein
MGDPAPEDDEAWMNYDTQEALVWECKRISTPGLAEVTVHPPRPLNESTGFYLDATVLIDKAPFPYEQRTVFVGLSKATLTIRSPRYQAVKGSMIGEKPGHPLASRKPDGVELKASSMGKYLTSEGLNDEPLATMEVVADGDERVDVALLVDKGGFVISATEEFGEEDIVVPSRKKSVMVNAIFFAERPVDPLHRAIVAKAYVRKKKKTNAL